MPIAPPELRLRVAACASERQRGRSPPAQIRSPPMPTVSCNVLSAYRLNSERRLLSFQPKSFSWLEKRYPGEAGQIHPDKRKQVRTSPDTKPAPGRLAHNAARITPQATPDHLAAYTIRTPSVHDPYTIRTPSVHHPYTIRTPCVLHPYTISVRDTLACTTLPPRSLP